MQPFSVTAATIAEPTPKDLVLSGAWTTLGIGAIDRQLDGFHKGSTTELAVDGTQVESLDTVGVWLVQKLVLRLRSEGHTVQMIGWNPRFSQLLELVAQHPAAPLPVLARRSMLARVGQATIAIYEHALALLSFIGEVAIALAGSIVHPARLRWRPILHHIGSAGVEALPIIGLLSFLLGVVIAYQAADQLREFGANLFVADLVGLSVLREFAPLMTAIIVAGRSGSAYAAQIGTMAVTEEIDALRTLDIAPIELLVLPKMLALILVLPLLTLFADVLGVFGGMVMARAQLGIGFEDFLDRFTKVVSVTAYLIGLGKAPVFAAIIAVVGCFQGLRTRGGADSVGRQTTKSVVHSIFLVIVADALFSIVFSVLAL